MLHPPPLPPLPPLSLSSESADTSSSWSAVTVKDNNELGLRILQDTENENVLLSPVSVYMVLNMILMGARGRTFYQISKQLGEPDPRSLSALLQELQSTSGRQSGATSLDMASAVVVQRGAPLNETYQRDISDLFEASLTAADFEHDGQHILNEINAWTKRRTRGRIGRFLQEPPNVATKMLILNALYFKGDWKTQFDPEFTDSRPFHNQDGTVSRVPTMFLIHNFMYGHDDGLDADVLVVPYADDRFSMILLIPRNRQNGIGGIVQGLSADKLKSILSTLKPQQIELSLPKLSLQKLLELRKPLESLGLKEPFSESANFTGISDRLDLRLDEVLHKAALDVDEVGTRAVASTEAQFVSKSLVRFTQFTVDRPFLALIQHDETGAIVFLAQVVFLHP